MCSSVYLMSCHDFIRNIFILCNIISMFVTLAFSFRSNDVLLDDLKNHLKLPLNFNEDGFKVFTCEAVLKLLCS